MRRNVVPWKRRLGYATRALALFLPDVRPPGLRFVELTTDVDNVPSQRVIEASLSATVAPPRSVTELIHSAADLA